MKNVMIFLTSMPDHGGAYQYWLAMIKSLKDIDSSKVSLEVIAFHDGWKEIAETHGISCTVYHGEKNVLRRIFSRWVPFYMRGVIMMYTPFILGHKLLKGMRFDLCLANYMVPSMSWFGMPVGVPIFDLMHRYERSFKEVSGDYYIREMVYKYESKNAKIIFVDSEVGKHQVIESYGKYNRELQNKLKVLPLVPPDYIYDLKELDDSALLSDSSNEFKRLLFKKYVFYPAQFWSHKNHYNLIKALAFLKKRGVDVNLILVGSEKNSRNRVERIIKRLNLDNSVKILGYVSNKEMVFLYKHARALVMPTYFGPTNIPPLEAFVLNCPVAISSIYAMPEQCGDAALYFSPDSYREIASCIERLWVNDELCSELVKKGQKRALEWTLEKFGAKVRQDVFSCLGLTR